ncbi:MAG: hypothetical protein AAF202_06020 [Pseudomonadota bacterium]
MSLLTETSRTEGKSMFTNRALSLLIFVACHLFVAAMGPALAEPAFDSEKADRILQTLDSDPLSTLEISFSEFIVLDQDQQKARVRTQYRALAKEFFTDRFRGTTFHDKADQVFRKLNLAKEAVDEKLKNPESLDPNPSVTIRQTSDNPTEAEEASLSDLIETAVQLLMKERTSTAAMGSPSTTSQLINSSQMIALQGAALLDTYWIGIMKGLRLEYETEPDTTNFQYKSSPTPFLQVANIVPQLSLLSSPARLYVAKENWALAKGFVTGLNMPTAMLQIEMVLAPILEAELGSDWKDKIEPVRSSSKSEKAEPSQQTQSLLCKLKLRGREIYDDFVFWLRYR